MYLERREFCIRVEHRLNPRAVVIPAKARDYVFTGVGLSVSLSVCLLPR